MDNETKQVLSEQEKLRLLTEHEGWATVHALLNGKIIELESIDDVDISSPENSIIDIKSRQMARKILKDWIEEIEDTVEQNKSNTSLLPKKESYIFRG